MSTLDDLTIACLNPEDLETIRALEKKLGPTIRLVAVQAKDVLYALEAKIAPNQWQRVDAVYPEIKDIKAYYSEHEAAKEVKGWLKGFLINNTLNPKPQKRPIRIRQVVNTESADKLDPSGKGTHHPTSGLRGRFDRVQAL
jgi:hypothetical protein